MEPTVSFPTLDRFTAAGGCIDIGRIDVLDGAAIASDDSGVWVALMRRDDEGFTSLLRRLDTTLARCLRSREPYDELDRSAYSARGATDWSAPGPARGGHDRP